MKIKKKPKLLKSDTQPGNSEMTLNDMLVSLCS